MLKGIIAGSQKTVAGVLTANKVLDALKEVERTNEAEATRQAQIIEEARSAHNKAIEEAALAREVGFKLTNLVSPVISDVTLDELKAECA